MRTVLSLGHRKVPVLTQLPRVVSHAEVAERGKKGEKEEEERREERKNACNVRVHRRQF